jgi:hypothetical protein
MVNSDLHSGAAWPGNHPVAFLPGSLPMGGVVPMTPVHAFDSVPPALRWQAQPTLQPARHDIELGGLLAFAIDQVTTPAEADAMVHASEQCGYRDEAPGIATPPGMRMNKSVHWVADPDMLGPMFTRIAHLLQQMGYARKHGAQHVRVGHPVHRFVHAHARRRGDAGRLVAVAALLAGVHHGVGFGRRGHLVDGKGQQAAEFDVMPRGLEGGLRLPAQGGGHAVKSMHGCHGHHATHGQRAR